jgi:GntR family transcriptional regulator/MocR family aminotransferase
MSAALLRALVQIDRTTGHPLVGQITQQLRALIARGRLPGGTQLPSSRALASALEVSRNTVSFAIEQLAAEGYVSLSRGRRPVVSPGLERTAGPGTRTRSADNHASPNFAAWVSRLRIAQWRPQVDEPSRPFRPGFADRREFPLDAWARCLRRATRRRTDHPDGSQNRRALQITLCDHLIAQRSINADPDQIILLPTAQSGLALIAAVLVRPGDTAWVESPGYGGARAAFEAVGAQLLGIPLDSQGLAPKAGTSPPTLIYTTPSHQYPTGRLMTVRRRLDLLRLAEANNAWIVEDDYDGEFHYDDRPVPSLQGLDSSGRVFYVGTFSKTTFADLRIGYLVVPRKLVDTFTIAQRHLGYLAPVQLQHGLADFMSEGLFLAHIRRARRLIETRRDHLVSALERHVGDSFHGEVPAGGMQLVAWCHDAIDDRALASGLAEAGVVARPVSSMFFRTPVRRGLFLGFAAWREDEIDRAVKIIRRVVLAGYRRGGRRSAAKNVTPHRS